MRRRTSRGSGSTAIQRITQRRRKRSLIEALERRTLLATFTVLNADDAGVGSLRQAILDANAAAGADDIDFDPGFFNVPRTITLTDTSGQLNITDDVTIAGPGASLLTVSGGGVVRIFNIDNTAGILNVAISGMTITGGNGTTNGTTAADGAAIRITNEVLLLENVVITGNTNTGANDGGGLATTSTAAVTIRNSTVSGNTSGKNGGGIYFFSGGSLTVENSTVSGNTAPGVNGGGGIYFFGTVAAGGITIRNSTIANNSATGTGSGGGIVLRSLTSNVNPVLIQNSTITGNSVATTSTTVGVGGGGIAISSGGANSIVNIESTIISGNTAGNGRDDVSAIAAATVNVNFSAIGDADGFTLSGTSANNLPFGATLNLLPLSNYGGPTQTVALNASSEAVDAGSNPASLTTDQRGPGFPRVLGAAADIGAIEGTLDLPFASGTFADITATTATYTFDIVYNSGSDIDVSTLDSNDILVTGPNGYSQLATFLSANPPANAPTVTATYRVTGPGGDFDPSDYGTYTIAVQPNQVGNVGGGFAPAADVGTFQVLIPQTFIVSNNNDSGPGSLRQAILNSNATAGATDNIEFQLVRGPTTITLLSASGHLIISDSVTIVGPGSGLLTVSGGGAVRIFNIDDGSAVTQIGVSISGMTITGGNGTSNGTTTADGGGVLIANERVTFDDIVITGNSNTGTTTDGGGLAASGVADVVIRNSTISGNTSGKNGGGIYFFSGGSLLLENSTVSGNTAPGINGGGGIYFFGTVAAGGFTILNSTIHNNSATAVGTATTGSGGGGIVFRSLTSNVNPVLIQNSTITGNSSASSATTVGFGGGGIALASGTANSIITLQNTIVAENTSANDRPDISALAAGTVNVNFCLIGVADAGFTPSGTSGDNLTGTLAAPLDPMLGALGDNGGPTETRLPVAGSPVLNAGSNALIPSGVTTDQRGAGFPRIQGPTVDIGSVERAVAVPPAVVNSDFLFETGHSLEFTFSETVSFPNGINAAFEVENLTTMSMVTINAVQNGPLVTVTFTPALLPDGNYRATVIAANVVGAGGPMAANVVVPFFFLHADANRDRFVNLDDFNVLAGNFGLSGRTFSQGNYDYDPAGNVNLDDFNILAAQFGKTLPPPAARPSSTGGQSLFGDRRIGDEDPLGDLLA